MGAHSVGTAVAFRLTQAGLFFLGAVLALLPGRLRLVLGAGLGIALKAFRFRAAVIQQNLDIAFSGEASAGERTRLFRAAYRHLGNLILELFLLPGPFRGFIRRNAKLKGLEHWAAAVRSGRPAMFVSSHVGNWEIMAATGARDGIPLMIVTKHLKPEALHLTIEAARRRCGVLGAYEPKTLKTVMRHLEAGGTVGFVLDQYAGPPVGVRVPFFGVNVGTATIVATLARRTGAAVLPVVNYRQADGTYVTEISPEAAWIHDDDPTRELAINTAAFARRIESDVRAHPDQWLWTHRRFKGDLSPLAPDEWSAGRKRS